MIFDIVKTRKLLTNFEFETLFIEVLGWNRHAAQVEVQLNGQVFILHTIAEKCGLAVFVCSPGADGRIPDDPLRRKIERQLTKSAHEHLIIFPDAGKTQQYWLWSRREPGRQPILRGEWYRKGETGERLAQKLQYLVVSLEEEEKLTLIAVTDRAKKAFYVERLTKKFYDRFQKEHAGFLKFLEGIPDEHLGRWYVSVMLDRLMFIYFIQKKGFLDGDRDYLKNKLIQCRNELGRDRFYRDFLCPLFFEGFARRKEERSENARKLLGEVPYLNGGIFMKHQIEEHHGQTITIPDQALEQLFEFFDFYQWTLEDRPLRDDREINPDVLGYIFEKYINAIQPGEQKAKGAYYTKEDITEYISKNTVIPFLFDAAREKCKVAFEGEVTVWKMLQEDPDRYIYPAVKHGVVREDGSIVPESALPDFVQAGMHDPKARMFEKRYNLQQASVEDPLRLPTETWREYVCRRTRCLELRLKLEAGQVHEINDLITYNLDIRRFAQDVIENCEGPELLAAFWNAVESVKVLDPTCGSGAFLFAALNILDPLYEACLERMRFFLEEWGEEGKKNHPNFYKSFTGTLERVKEHPNHRYFVLKSIIVNNLYGVDIMEEAVEICKLRLFLKLVAQIERVEDIEPLPDIDFNIRAGNTLVGYANEQEVRNAFEQEATGVAKETQGKLLLGEAPEAYRRFEDKLLVVDALFNQFQRQQTEFGGVISEQDKENLRLKLKELEDELNRYLAGEYRVDVKKAVAFENWLTGHKPFHWFVEFYGIMKSGGFDVIIGNPPYVEYNKIKEDYSIYGYKTEECANLYAFVIERNAFLLRLHGRTSMIVPHSAICTDRMAPIQWLFSNVSTATWISTYCIRPAKLFVGVDQRLCIYFTLHNAVSPVLFASRYHRWHEEFRPYLFYLIQNARITELRFSNSMPKIHNALELALWHKISKYKLLRKALSHRPDSTAFFHNAPRYWVRAMDFAPYFWNERDGEQISTQVKGLRLSTKTVASVVVAMLNSSLFYWWFLILSDCRHLNMREIENFPLGLDHMTDSVITKLASLSRDLMADFDRHKVRKECRYKTTGKVIYDEFYPKHSKHIIDEIDQVLAQHYGFTDEELDFIINYDIKYRMGGDSWEVK